MIKSKDAVLKEVSYYLVALLVCLVWLYWALQLWNADLTIPFNYGIDSIYFGTLVKGLVDNGWYTVNPYIGVPVAFNLYDFPFNCNLEFFIMKVLTLFNSSWAWVINNYFLLTFPLTIITTLFALRVLKVTPLPSIAGSLLFTFVPFHLGRGIGHINLQTVFLVPLAMLMVYWVFEDEFMVNQFKRATRHNLAPIFHWKNVLSVIFCIAIASTFFYNPFFSCIFLCFAGVASAVVLKRYTPVFNVLILAGLMLLIVVLYNITSLIHILEYGWNSEVIIRGPQESEVYGLKIIQLLIPATGHQVPFFASIANQYASTAPLVNENRLAALGIIGSLGFVFLIIWVFYRLFSRVAATGNELAMKLDQLSGLNLVALLLATVGGFGTIFSYLIVPWIRSYNRISVFIAFFAMTAVILFIDLLVRRYSASRLKQWVLSVCLIVVVVAGLYDQTTTHIVPAYNTIKAEFTSDRDFVNNIEKTYPAVDMVFQLPCVPFPEFGQLNKWRVYDHFRGYLHSKNIRWSYGTMQGRDGDVWQQYISSKPLKEMIQELSLSGFNGIYLDSYGYTDAGKAEITAISFLLDTAPIASANGRLYFFDMTSYNESIKSRFSADEIKKHREQLNNLSSYEWLGGALIAAENNVNVESMTCNGNSTLYYIDQVNGKPGGDAAPVYTVNYGKGRNVMLSGWAVDEKSGTPAAGVYINIDGTRDIPAFYGQARPDVGEYFKNTNYTNSGFRAYLPSTLLGKGKHALALKIIAADGKSYYLPEQRVNVYVR